MFISVLSGLDRVLNDTNLSSVANGLRSGSGTVNYLSNINHEPGSKANFAVNCWQLGKTALRAKKVVGSHPFVTRHKTAAILAVASVAFFNFVELAINQGKPRREGYGSYKGERIGTSSTIANATVVGVVIINLAFTAYEWRTNPAKVVFAVAGIGLSVLDQQNMLPEAISTAWKALPLPLASIAFYYGDTVSRMIITVDVIAGFINKQS
jgi:hypothetical protein